MVEERGSEGTKVELSSSFLPFLLSSLSLPTVIRFRFIAMSPSSLLSIILACDNVPPISTLPLLPFFLNSTSTTPIGHLQLKVWDAISSFTSSTTPSASSGPLFARVESPSPKIFFSSWCDSVEKRTVALAELAQALRQSQVFKVPLDGWRNETYTIYGPAEECPGEESQRGKTFGRNVAFSLERAACG